MYSIEKIAEGLVACFYMDCLGIFCHRNELNKEIRLWDEFIFRSTYLAFNQHFLNLRATGDHTKKPDSSPTLPTFKVYNDFRGSTKNLPYSVVLQPWRINNLSVG